jgi:hypothetical protein
MTESERKTRRRNGDRPGDDRFTCIQCTNLTEPRTLAGTDLERE